MKKEVKHLYQKGIQSLVLSIELFNRPNDVGRVHGVLIFMDHSFEMLLKAAILHKGGKIKESKGKQTIGFSSCVRKAFSEKKISFLSEEGVLTLQSLNGLRDAAQHYTLEMAEQHLYIQAQAGLTLFRDIVQQVFKIDLKTQLPLRVLPISTTPPVDIQTFFESEVGEIKEMLKGQQRKTFEAMEKLRALAIMENSLQGIESQPSDNDLKKIVDGLRQGQTINQLFAGVSTLNFTQNGYGPSLDLRISKSDGVPITLVPAGTPGSAVVAIKRVNELDFYNLSATQLAEKAKVGANKLFAVIKELKIQDNSEAFKEIRIGKMSHKRYSPLALQIIKAELPKLDLEEVWQKHRPRSKKKAV